MRGGVRRACSILAGLALAGATAAVVPAGVDSGTVASSPTPAPSPPAYDPHLVLVRFRPGTPASSRSNAHAAARGRVEHTMDWLDLDVVRLPDDADPADAAARYRHDPNVAAASPDWQAIISSVPDDDRFGDLWGLDNQGQTVRATFSPGVPDVDIDAPEGWDVAFGAGVFPPSGGTRVGILDTGIDATHPDLAGKRLACASAVTATGVVGDGCADDSGHGTHVAGTVAALAGNGAGVAGVAPNAGLAVFKAFDSSGHGSYADVIAGIHWLHAVGGVRVISMSFTGPPDPTLDAELAEASAAGTLLVAAAGNDGSQTLEYPAAHPDVMSVSAVDASGTRPWFSNCNSDVEIAAPGSGIWSTGLGGGYEIKSGTSMAVPHVSGVAAMVMWALGTSAARTRSLLTESAQGDGGCESVGIVNLAAALERGGELPPAATSGAIAGRVIDVRSKRPLAGAGVDCGPAGAATTDPNGNFAIARIPAGSYRCTASAVDHRSKSQNVNVSPARVATANFALR